MDGLKIKVQKIDTLENFSQKESGITILVTEKYGL